MGENKLLEGISREAVEEAELILSRAEKQAEAKRKGLEYQLQTIRKESEAERAKQVEEIRRRSGSSIKSATRRASLKYREELYNRVIRMAEEKVRDMIATSAYPHLQAKLIAEAVIGLNRDEALISVSHLETLEPAILTEAAALVKEAVGRQVALKPASDPLPSQGISAASTDGRISFNNQIHTRFRRYDQEIKKIVYDELENKE